jgi:hypothetical protein
VQSTPYVLPADDHLASYTVYRQSVHGVQSAKSLCSTWKRRNGMAGMSLDVDFIAHVVCLMRFSLRLSSLSTYQQLSQLGCSEPLLYMFAAIVHSSPSYALQIMHCDASHQQYNSCPVIQLNPYCHHPRSRVNRVRPPRFQRLIDKAFGAISDP